MVRGLIAFLVLLFLALQSDGAAANDIAGPQPLSAETAAIFGAGQPGQTADEDEADEEESDAEEANDADEKDGAKDKKKSEPEPADKSKDKEEKAENDEAVKKGPTKADNDDDGKDAKEEKATDKPAEKPDSSEKKSEGKKSSEKKPETVKVKTKDLKIQVEADGVFVAEQSEEVALRPEVWSSFQVLEAVPHGKRVRKGDVLVKFDAKDFDEALAKKEIELRLGELALMEAEEEFPRTEKSIALNYEQAQRAYEQAKDEYGRFEDQMREMSEKMAEYYLKSAEQDFESAQEELDQLVKMYEADELTEETEEIVLRRQKFQVETAKFFVDYSKINHEYTLKVSIPRREEMLKTAVEMAKIEFERAKMAKSLGMNQQRYELQALREARQRSVEEHAKLVEDRNLMTLKAPADGIAYYGRQVNGRWIEVSSLEQKLIPFGTVSANSVVMTVVKDRPLYVETSIGEKELPTVEEDQEVIVTPAADSDVELKGTVEEVDSVPGGGNKFAVRIEIEGDELPEWLMPGMTCKSKITTYEAEDAAVVPADLVQSDEEDPKKKYVMLQVEDEDEPVRRDIKLGKSKDKEVEVLKGLNEGDVIVKGAKDKSSDEDESENDDKDADEKKE